MRFSTENPKTKGSDEKLTTSMRDLLVQLDSGDGSRWDAARHADNGKTPAQREREAWMKLIGYGPAQELELRAADCWCAPLELVGERLRIR